MLVAPKAFALPLVTLSIDFLDGIITLDRGIDDQESKSGVSGGS